MKVVIAEKPSLARAIKEAVGAEYTVTNAFGHIFELAEPDEYLPPDVPVNSKGKKIWRMEDLPIVPDVWKKVAKPDAKQQISKIRDLLKGASLVVNAGDPDREGQLLIDEILEELKYRGPVQRVWLQSLTPEAIRSAFQKMRPNSEYRPLSDSATARSHADWLVGMNLSRAWTLRAGSLISIGRVQTPTLALVVNRDIEIENFQPRDYFEVHAQVQHPNGGFLAKWRPTSTDGPGFDPDGRLLDRSIAEAVAAKAKTAGQIKGCKAEQKTRQAPLPYSLSALQKAASAKLGLGAKEVLDLAQQLYEQQLTTYPRTDCQYLAEDQLPGVFAAAQRLAERFGVEVQSRKHGAFNDGKVTAHTAIVPTGKDASGLTGSAAQLYDLIARSTVAMFMPPEAYTSVSVEVDLEGETFVATGRTVQDPGWTALYGKESDEEDAEGGRVLPVMRQGDAVRCGGAELKALKTKPPARWTEGTLIDAMSHVHRYVTDEAAKSKLKKTSGIGTEATRASILETLFRRGWIERKGKQLISTPAGRAIVAAVQGPLTDPVTTARWEDLLSSVAAGTLDAGRFEAAIVAFVGEQLAACKQAKVSLPVASAAPGKSGAAGSNGKKGVSASCPVCKLDLRRLESKTKKGSFFWVCNDRAHGPFSDVNGKPGKAFGK
jgi:DNA topoisomerase-3